MMRNLTRFAPRRQQGGTLTGLIIGLIIGLLIAAGVAVAIMKTPLPFVDKLGKQSQPAGELGDPNKTLPGGARERRDLNKAEDDLTSPAVTVPSFSATPANVPSTKPAEANNRSNANPSSANLNSSNSISTSSVVPGASAPAGAAAAPAAPTATTGDGSTYYLQAGAFREVQDAEATKAKLALMGVAASIAERKSDLGVLYRVRIGPFAEVEAMNRARARLSDNGVDAAVVRVPK
jgi:cell division protein FtsN